MLEDGRSKRDATLNDNQKSFKYSNKTLLYFKITWNYPRARECMSPVGRIYNFFVRDCCEDTIEILTIYMLIRSSHYIYLINSCLHNLQWDINGIICEERYIGSIFVDAFIYEISQGCVYLRRWVSLSWLCVDMRERWMAQCRRRRNDLKKSNLRMMRE